MNLYKYLLICLLSLVAMPVSATESNALIKKIEEVYKHRFKNGTVDGESYQSEDVLEIVKVSDNSIYFRIKLEFFNVIGGA